MLLNTYSKGNTNDPKGKGSKLNTDRGDGKNLSVPGFHGSQLGMTDASIVDDKNLKYSVSTLQVENMLKLNSDTRIEMATIDTLDFNIFYVRD